MTDLVRADPGAGMKGVDDPPFRKPHAEAPRIVAGRGQSEGVGEKEHAVREQGAQQSRVVGWLHASIIVSRPGALT